MNIDWICDPGNEDGTKGGAELTMDEFHRAAPEGVEWFDESEVVVIGNCVTFSADLISDIEGKRVVRYWHDLNPHGDPDLRSWLLENAINIFTSPLHAERFPYEVSNYKLIPPALDVARLRPTKQVRKHTERRAAVCIGAFQNPGKAGHLVAEWANRTDTKVDYYGFGPFGPRGPRVEDHGPIDPNRVPSVLWEHKTFVFLPTAIEPFGRCVAEAYLAGCEVVTNDNVGATFWLETKPEAIATAAEDFWAVVLGG